jgi:LmbE family N-acetylglucosaminyl deacetylase
LLQAASKSFLRTDTISVVFDGFEKLEVHMKMCPLWRQKRFLLLIILLLLLFALPLSQAGNRNTYPLAEERGTAGALNALGRLPVYARVLHITAHPDDESAGTLTWLSRKFHAQTALFCLTRGEGGQNILGNEKYDALGLVRTGELLEACRYYGAELYFGSNIDFGFSKTAEETFSKWGHEAALEEMVRFIRIWRPTIIISRFQGDASDGHGHHQAAGILAREAFLAAGDPKKFPEQLKGLLQPWQPKKLYVSSRPWGEPSSGGEKSQIIKVPVGDYDPVLGRSYREIATEGYSKHRTQGNGNTYAFPGQAYEYFRLAESAIGNPQSGNTFFDSIDTSLMAIWDLAGDEKQAVSFLKEDLVEIQKAAEEALSSFQIAYPEKSASAAARGIKLIRASIEKLRKSSLSDYAKRTVEDALQAKHVDFYKAVNAVLGVRLIAKTDEATAVPGEELPLELRLYNQGPEKIVVVDTGHTSRGGTSGHVNWEGKEVTGRSSLTIKSSFEILRDSQITEPYWYLDKSSDARYKFRNNQNEFLPFSWPKAISFFVQYAYQGAEFFVEADGMAEAGDPMRGADFIDFQIVPSLSVTLNPVIEISSTGSKSKTHEFQVSVLNNRKSGARGKLKLDLPEGWRAEPGEVDFTLPRKGDTFTTRFILYMPPETKPGRYQVEAIAVMDKPESRRDQVVLISAMENLKFQRGYDVISYPENWTRNLYRPAQSRIERFDISVAPNLTVGYIPGAGDDIPPVLEQLGIKVQLLSPADLAFGDLKRFSAIITGIRAYNVNEDLRANNQRLLDYVAQGGTLIVQYVRPLERGQGASGGSEFPFGPYPMSVSATDRITVEETPIKILDPSNPIFTSPNKISPADFEGWVQERGLYFMRSWDPHYSTLLSGNDPGEAPKDGGMLMARYGKGIYIYTAYAWFRQLPAGVPGAIRIFANIVSLGQYAPQDPASAKH